MISKNTAADVLTAVMDSGGDFAELFIEHTRKNTITMVNGSVNKAMSGIDYGCGIRIFNGTKEAYAYSNDTSKDNLIKMACDTSRILNNTKRASIFPFMKLDVCNSHKIIKMPGTVNKKDICVLLRQASDAAISFSKSISETVCSYFDSTQDVCIINSEGLWAEDRRVRTRVMGAISASSDNEKQTSTFVPGAFMGTEFLEHIDILQLSIESAEIATKMLEADFCHGGKMSVVIDAGGGIIFHEACGHGLEATSVASGFSEMKNKIGEKIASEHVTAIDDGSICNAWGSQNIDDEGAKTQKNILIEKGVLKTYLVDKLSCKKIGIVSTGSSRRESYKFPPTSRMTNTYISNGHHSPKDIIQNTEYGLYAKKVGGGSVQPENGIFNFSVLEGYIISEGKIIKPVKGMTVIGKGSEVLTNIDMVADNLGLTQALCGSTSGIVPVCVGQPMIRVNGLIVGGRV